MFCLGTKKGNVFARVRLTLERVSEYCAFFEHRIFCCYVVLDFTTVVFTAFFSCFIFPLSWKMYVVITRRAEFTLYKKRICTLFVNGVKKCKIRFFLRLILDVWVIVP